MQKSLNKFATLGSIDEKFRDLKNHYSTSHAGTKRKTKRQLKRIASRANRIFVKKLSKEQIHDLQS